MYAQSHAVYIGHKNTIKMKVYTFYRSINSCTAMLNVTK